MTEGFFKHFATFSGIFRRLPMIFEDLRKIKNAGRSFLALCDSLPIFPKTSEDFGRLPKISENFQNIPKIPETCWNVCFLHSPVLSSKFSKEFPNIQQRRHKLLLPVTNFSCMLLISNHTIFLV